MASSSKSKENSQHNGHSSPTTDNNYLNNNGKVICDDMVYYCFDVLNNYFNKSHEPPTPNFTNNEFPLFGNFKSIIKINY